MVIKRDGSRQAFDPSKLINGLMRAAVKCSVSSGEMMAIAREVEGEIAKRFPREISSLEIGEAVLERLKAINEVAFVRFASVYRQFSSIEDFVEALTSLETLKKQKTLQAEKAEIQ
ncbi:MAG TPA: transcriptional repressor NrdR [Cyanobacteria bacterium UBA8530]|nr:transcriptional repressor NrdR [Cyanobacteria bacterium UBA8530]